MLFFFKKGDKSGFSRTRANPKFVYRVLANSKDPHVMPQNALFHQSALFDINLLYDVASESEITSCIQIDKPLVVYRFSGNVMK